MRKTLSVTLAMAVTVMLAMFSFASSAIDTIACEINEIRMSVAVPSDMPFVTRESKESDAYFTSFKLDYDQIMENFEEGNIYLQAMKKDKSLTMTVSSEINESSRKADNFNKLSDDALAEVKAAYLSVGKNEFKSGSVVEYNGIKYICFVRKGDTGCDYNTVVNGRDYHIHFQTKSTAKMTSSDKELIESVIKGTGIIEDNFVNNNHDLLLYGGVSVFGVLLVAAVVILVLKKTKSSRKNRRHSHLVHELAHEHKISDTTRIPRKRLEDITEPTMTFLRDYQPVDELEGETSDADEAAPAGKTAAAKADTATFVSASPKETEKADNEDVNAIAAEVRIAAAAEMAAKLQQDAVELPKPDYEETQPAVDDEPKLETAESAEQSFDDAKDYFDDDAVNIYSSGKAAKPQAPAQPVEENVAEAAVTERDDIEHYDVDDDSEDYEEEEVYESHAAENAKKVFSAVGRGLARFFKALGRGILAVLSTIWTIIIYIVVHCKYFCINLSRAIKRRRNIKKRQKLQQQRQEQSQQQHRDDLARRRAQRDAARARHEANSRRGANDLVKVHSREESRPARRPSDRTAYPRNRRS